MSAVREVTREERDAMLADGAFDINGNFPFHPGYTGIHQLANGRFVHRSRSDYGTPSWIGNQVEVTDEADIAAISAYMSS